MNATVSFDTSPQDVGGNMTLAVIPDVLMETSPLMNATVSLTEKAIDVVVAVPTVASTGANVIVAGKAAVDFYNRIARKIKAKSDASSCTPFYGTEYDEGLYYEGYAYQATATGSHCDTTAILEIVQDAVQECATKLHNAGAIRGRCKFSHGGTWDGQLQLTADPDSFPATPSTC